MKQLRDKALKDFLKDVKRPGRDLTFILQDVEDPVNIGAAFRIADACAVQELILTGLSPTPPDPAIAGIGRGTHRRVKWSYTKYASDAIETLQAQGYTSCAVEVTAEAVPYYRAAYPAKVCLIVGHEYHGLTRRTLSVCDMAVYIPMYGKINSLNVHTALGIVAYHILHA